MLHPRARAAVVLPHHVEIAGEMFIEDVAGADAKSVAHPVVLAPVIERLSETNQVNLAC